MSLGHRTKSYTTCVRLVESKLFQKDEGAGAFPPYLPCSLWPGTGRKSDCTSSLRASVDPVLPSLFPGSRPLRAGFAADWDQHDGVAWRPPPGCHPSAGSAVSPSLRARPAPFGLWLRPSSRILKLLVVPPLRALSWRGSLRQSIGDAMLTQQILTELGPETWRNQACPVPQGAGV